MRLPKDQRMRRDMAVCAILLGVRCEVAAWAVQLQIFDFLLALRRSRTHKARTNTSAKTDEGYGVVILFAVTQDMVPTDLPRFSDESLIRGQEDYSIA